MDPVSSETVETAAGRMCPLFRQLCLQGQCAFWRVNDCSIVALAEGFTLLNVHRTNEYLVEESPEVKTEAPTPPNVRTTSDADWDDGWGDEEDDKIPDYVLRMSLVELTEYLVVEGIKKLNAWSLEAGDWSSLRYAMRIGNESSWPKEERAKLKQAMENGEKLYVARVAQYKADQKALALTKINDCFQWALTYSKKKLTQADVESIVILEEPPLHRSFQREVWLNVNRKLAEYTPPPKY